MPDGAINNLMAWYLNGDVCPGGCAPHKRPKKQKKSVPNVVSLSDSDSEGQVSEEKENFNL